MERKVIILGVILILLYLSLIGINLCPKAKQWLLRHEGINGFYGMLFAMLPFLLADYYLSAGYAFLTGIVAYLAVLYWLPIRRNRRKEAAA